MPWKKISMSNCKRVTLYLFLSIDSCLQDTKCKAYKYSSNKTENCVLIREATGSSNSFASDKENQLYKKGWFKINVDIVQLKYLKRQISSLYGISMFKKFCKQISLLKV